MNYSNKLDCKRRREDAIDTRNNLILNSSMYYLIFYPDTTHMSRGRCVHAQSNPNSSCLGHYTIYLAVTYDIVVKYPSKNSLAPIILSIKHNEFVEYCSS